MPTPFTFDADSHVYAVDGVAIPSVTGCLRAAGIADYSGVPVETLEYKRQIGAVVDQFADLLDDEDADWGQVSGTAIEGYCLAYENFRCHSGFKTARRKPRGVMRLNGALCGWEADRVGTWHGMPAVVDLKCTAAVERSFGPQLAAYERALFMEDGLHRRRLVVQLLPDGSWKPHLMADPQDIAVFQWALALTVWKANNK